LLTPPAADATISTMLRRCGLVILMSLLALVDARAQERFVVRGLGFGTFGSPETQTTRLFGVGVGMNLSPVVQVTIEAAQEWGRADPRNPVRALADPGTSPGPVQIIAFLIDSIRQDRRLTGGIRLRAPIRFRLEPFVVANAGLARVTERYASNPFGDEGLSGFHPLVEGGGGLSLRLTDRVALEASYRYGRVIWTYGFDVHALGGGLALGF